MLPLTSDNCDPHVLRAKWMRAQVYIHALLRRYETLGVLPLTADNCDPHVFRKVYVCAGIFKALFSNIYKKCICAQVYLRLYYIYAPLRDCEGAIQALLRSIKATWMRAQEVGQQLLNRALIQP